MNNLFTTPDCSGFLGSLTRRGFFRGSGIAALAGLFGANRAAGKRKGPVTTYESIGVKPVINCWGTMTILSGSLMLPEVNAAIEESAKHYVHMDELMEGAGKRLAELTGAEWGIVTSGAAGALAGATAACMAGADPEKMAMLPDTTGMPNEVIVHRSHRNVYDRSLWMTGARMVEVDSREAMEAAVNDKTAVIMVLGEALDNRAITLEEIVAIGKKHSVPVLVDAAAERPDVPNIYLKAGADLVTYSGGKCLRGPQSAGILLGRKDLCRAAFLNISPHHGFGRPMKVGKEEVIGMLTALDMWINHRDHKAEFSEWERKLGYIVKTIMRTPGVAATINQPRGRSNVAPTLSISWDTAKVRISPEEAHRLLREGKPRIWMPSSGRGLSIMSYMMEKGDEVVVAKRLREIFTAASA
jgi:L-seryl-tRNA(Ser) seleniumtransferase